MADGVTRAALILAFGVVTCSGDPGMRDAVVDSATAEPDASDGGGEDAALDAGERIPCYATLAVCPPEMPYCCGWNDTGPVQCEPIQDPRYDHCRENPPPGVTQAADPSRAHDAARGVRVQDAGRLGLRPVDRLESTTA